MHPATGAFVAAVGEGRGGRGRVLAVTCDGPCVVPHDGNVADCGGREV